MTQRRPTEEDTAAPQALARVLVVEDETLFARAVARRLEKAGYTCRTVGRLAEAEAALREDGADLMLLDMRLPDGSGLDFLQRLRERLDPQLAVIAMSAYGEVEDAVAAMKHAASDYLKKPIDLEELLVNVEKVLANQRVSRQLEYSRTRESTTAEAIEIIGDSTAAQALRAQIERIASLGGGAAMDAPTVLISGETGTGKDLAARHLHRCSRRAARPFVHVDCAALPKDLIEAELFGHVKGAFTSALGERTGLIEAAEDGVVFLDEIGELPLELQAKLLAVLERRTLRRVGSSQERRTQSWFVAATNRDVEKMVAEGALRADLYYRLNVLPLKLPPLRERGDDAILIAERCAQQVVRRYGLGPVSFTAAAKARLRAYAWPGNIRELRHLIERAILLAGGGVLDAPSLLLPGDAPPPAAQAPLDVLAGLTLAAAEKLLIEHALRETGNNVSEAARKLGVTRMTMRYRMKQHGIEPG
ncbi:MAG TPA: sigma-54 dependent transcriptional regulator [Gammaproteobacteria bacterium]|nr:sigma-54 dependent transcriptional regulator [Gammaproteobacteria bacterium]